MNRLPTEVRLFLSALALVMLSACGGGEETEQQQAQSERRKALALSVAPVESAPALNLESQDRAIAIGIGIDDDLPPPVLLTPRLLGTGIPGTRMPGCQPTIHADFVDSVAFHQRRALPGDCSILKVAVPLFSWPAPADRNPAVPFRLTIRRAAGDIAATRTATVTRAWTPSALPAGDYTWQVSYQTTAAATVNSTPRRFSIPGRVAAWTPPETSRLVQSVVSKPHPRVLPPGASHTQLAALAQAGLHKAPYDMMVNWSRIWQLRPIPVPPESRSAIPAAGTMLGEVLQERSYIETLGHFARFTNDTAMKRATLNRVVALSNWLPTGVSSEAASHEISREIALTLGVGFDLVGDLMTAQQRSVLANSVRVRVSHIEAKFDTLEAYPYQSHLTASMMYALESLLYTAGMNEYPESGAQLGRLWEAYRNLFNVWGGDDGGFGNGVAYGWHYLTEAARSFAALRLVAGVDMMSHPYAAGLGDFLSNFTAPTSSRISAFGDDLSLTTLYSALSSNYFRLLADLSRKPEHAWYWRADSRNLTPGYLSPAHFMLLGLNSAPVVPAAPTAHSYVSADAGLAALHSDASDPNRSTVYFRSSQQGTWNHSHADHNSFTFDSRGRNLLISAGYNPWYRSRHHETVQRTTRYKNALTFNGGIGQAEKVATLDLATEPTAPGIPALAMEPRGDLINHADNGLWAVVTGDATQAYQFENLRQRHAPMLSAALRTAAMNRKQRVTLIYDYAASASPRKWELNFHALQAFSPIGAGMVKVSNGTSNACISVVGMPGGSSFAQTTGFVVAPERPAPNQWHLRHTANVASRELASVTVIREDCRFMPVDVTFRGSVASVSINGAAPIVFDKRTVAVPQ